MLARVVISLAVLPLAGMTPRVADAAERNGKRVDYVLAARAVVSLAKFVRWPERARRFRSRRLRVGLLGRVPRPMAAELRRLAAMGTTVHGLELEFTQLRELAEVPPALDVLYVCPSERQRIIQVIAKFASRPVLLVSDVIGFARAGGTVELRPAQGRLSITICVGRVRRTKLRIMPPLLKGARLVRDREPAAAPAGGR